MFSDYQSTAEDEEEEEEGDGSESFCADEGFAASVIQRYVRLRWKWELDRNRRVCADMAAQPRERKADFLTAAILSVGYCGAEEFLERTQFLHNLCRSSDELQAGNEK